MTAALIDELRALPLAQREAALEIFTPEEQRALYYDWNFWARPNQLEPSGEWEIWLVLSGRGFGKTRMGAEWIKAQVYDGARYIHLVGETAGDVRDVMIEGESGILATADPWFVPVYEPSKRRLTWPNGAIANLFSGEEPDQLRGPQCQIAWVDELAKMRYARDAWDNLMMGMRLKGYGEDINRAVVTTTPRPIPIIRELTDDPETVVTRGSSYDNRGNLTEGFAKRIFSRYEGTRLGRQELHGEILEDTPGALWAGQQLETLRLPSYPAEEMLRVAVSLDPSVTDPNKEGLDDVPDEWGIIVSCTEPHANPGQVKGYVLEDASGLYSPAEALARGAECYRAWEADVMVGEVNNGGDLIEALLRSLPNTRDIVWSAVRASRGKMKRAEPVASLYEQARIHHIGHFPDLESEMTTYTGAPGELSPNRLDAMVWGFTELLLDGIEGGAVAISGI